MRTIRTRTKGDKMTNENNILKVNAKIEKSTTEFGGHENACCLEAPYHGCNPNYPNRWQASALRISGNIVEHGRLTWNFDNWVEENGDRDDAADYPWDDCDGFESEETFDLEDDDDLESVMDLLK